MKPKRILITRTDRLGDVVLSTPVIRHMRRLYPDAHIAFMVKPANKGVVSANPHLDEIIVYDKEFSHKSLWSTVLFAARLRREKYDLAIALHPTNRVHMILFLAGIPARVGYDRKMPWLLTRRVHHQKQKGQKHEAEYNFDLLAAAGIDVRGADPVPYMRTTDEDKRVVDGIMKSSGLGANVIAVHPGASCPSKLWPAGNFAAVADAVKKKYGADIVLLGGDETEAYSRAVADSMRQKAVDLTGTLLLGELAELLSRCRLFISNDSGPVHVAVAVGTPVVSIFGRKDPGLSPRRWGPLGPGNRVVHGLSDCQVCLAHKCSRSFSCINAVTPREVVAAADDIIRDIPG